MACQGCQWTKWKTTSTIQVTFIQAVLTKKVPGELQEFLVTLFLEAHGKCWQHKRSASLPSCFSILKFVFTKLSESSIPFLFPTPSQTCPPTRATKVSGTAWMLPLSVHPARTAMPTWRSPENPAWSRQQRKAHVSSNAWVFGCIYPCALSFQFILLRSKERKNNKLFLLSLCYDCFEKGWIRVFVFVFAAFPAALWPQQWNK